MCPADNRTVFGLRLRNCMPESCPSPEDLELLAQVDEALTATSSIASDPGPSRPDSTSVQHAWLRLLSFAYASGVLDSEEICRLCRDRNWIGTLCPAQTLEANDLCRFRREHRDRLEAVLARILPDAEREPHARFDPRWAGESPAKLARAKNVLNLARHLDTCE